MKDFLLAGNVRIFGEMESRPVYRAAERFYRDVKKTFPPVIWRGTASFLKYKIYDN